VYGKISSLESAYGGGKEKKGKRRRTAQDRLGHGDRESPTSCNYGTAHLVRQLPKKTKGVEPTGGVQGQARTVELKPNDREQEKGKSRNTTFNLRLSTNKGGGGGDTTQVEGVPRMKVGKKRRKPLQGSKGNNGQELH